MSRFFAFGCSYTYYSWPTWADFVGLNHDVYENWAIPGIGNRAILERLVECNVKNQFGKDDLVVVQWSSHLRHDFFTTTALKDRNTAWKTSGSIFNYINRDLYDDQWIYLFFDERAYFMHTLNYILAAQNLLENTDCKWYMTSIGDLRKLGRDLNYDNTIYGEKTLKSGKGAWEEFPELQIYENPIWTDRENHWLEPLHTFSIQNDTFFYKMMGTKDHHPTPRHHWNWAKNQDELVPSLCDFDHESLLNSIDQLYEQNKSKQRSFFDRELDQGNFNRPAAMRWPTQLRGFL